MSDKRTSDKRDWESDWAFTSCQCSVPQSVEVLPHGPAHKCLWSECQGNDLSYRLRHELFSSTSGRHMSWFLMAGRKKWCNRWSFLFVFIFILFFFFLFSSRNQQIHWYSTHIRGKWLQKKQWSWLPKWDVLKLYRLVKQQRPVFINPCVTDAKLKSLSRCY